MERRRARVDVARPAVFAAVGGACSACAQVRRLALLFADLGEEGVDERWVACRPT